MTDAQRIRAERERLRSGDDALHVRGVTYGPFRSGRAASAFPAPAAMATDLRKLRGLGINAVRIAGLPPTALVDLAGEYGIRLFPVLRFHDWRAESGADAAARRRITAAALRAVDDALDALGGRPEVLGVAVAEQVPAELMCVFHRHHVERTLTAMIDRLHAGDPGLLTTYVTSSPSDVERIPNQDLFAFDASTTQTASFASDIDHVRAVSNGRPVIVTDVGKDGAVRGPATRAELLGERLRHVRHRGLAGAFVFSWADEWVVGGSPVHGWRFEVGARRLADEHGRRHTGAGAPTLAAWDRGEVWPRSA